ncbi:hypothetical protein P4S70_05020 [Enterovibrio sp. Hal110]
MTSQISLVNKEGGAETQDIFNFYILSFSAAIFYFLIYPYIVFILSKGWGGGLYFYTDLQADRDFFRGFLVSLYVFVSYLVSFFILKPFLVGKVNNLFNFNVLINKRIIYFAVVVSVFIYLPWIGVDRATFKSTIGFWHGEILIATAMLCFLLGMRGTNKEKLFSVLVFLAIVFAVREREYVLFLVALLWFSFQKNSSRLMLVVLGVLTIMFYKSFFNLVTGNATPTFFFDDVYHFLRFSAMDARHNINLMYSYMIEDAPDYSHQSIYFPHWFRNILGESLISNSRMASDYYSSNMTGTGFNHALELWLNFRLFIPVFCFVTTAMLAVVARFGPLLIAPTLTFLVKTARGDFSTLVVVWIVLPVILVSCLYLIDRFCVGLLIKKYFNRKSGLNANVK